MNSLDNIETKYALWFDGYGYYAAHQPVYEWCFTYDLSAAELYTYSSKDALVNRAFQCSRLKNVQIRVDTVIVSISFDCINSTELDILTNNSNKSISDQITKILTNVEEIKCQN